MKVGLTLQADEKGAVTTVTGEQTMRLYGPGDIIGIDTRLIVRTDPKPFATNFEPNYLALVEFDPPDFPWMFSPAQGRRFAAAASLARAARARPRSACRCRDCSPARRCLRSRSPSAHTATELPNLADAWMWAHAQAASAL